MKKRVLLDLYFQLDVGKFFSVNILASNLLAMLSNLKAYEVDVVVGLGKPFDEVEGKAALDLVWNRYYKDVFPKVLKKNLRIRKAFYHSQFFEKRVKEYDALIQVVSCYPIKQYNYEKSIIIHCDFITMERFYGGGFVANIAQVYEKNLQDKYVACISGPVHKTLLQFSPEAKDFSKTLPVAVGHIDAQLSRPCKEFSEIVNQYIATPMNDNQSLAASGQKYVMQIGALDLFFDRKNHKLTLEAWDKYCQMFPEKAVKLVLLGMGVGDKKTLSTCKDLEVSSRALKKYVEEGRILMLEKVAQEDVMSLIKGAECVVFPSKAEGFGIPLIESMLLGCPVIASDIEVSRWVAGDAALYCDPYDPDTLVNCFIKLMVSSGKEELCQKLVTKGYENAKRFSLKTVGQQWEVLLDEVTAPSKICVDKVSV